MVVNHVTEQTEKPTLRFSDIGPGVLFRHLNRESEHNIYMKLGEQSSTRSVLLKSGQVCTPSPDSLIEIVRGLYIKAM